MANQWVKMYESTAGGSNGSLEFDFDPDFTDAIQEVWLYAEIYIPQVLRDAFDQDGGTQDGPFFFFSDEVALQLRRQTPGPVYKWKVLGSGFTSFTDWTELDEWVVLEVHQDASVPEFEIKINGTTYGPFALGATTGFNFFQLLPIWDHTGSPVTIADVWYGIDNLAFSTTGWVSEVGADSPLWDFDAYTDLATETAADYPDPPFTADQGAHTVLDLRTDAPGPGPGPPSITGEGVADSDPVGPVTEATASPPGGPPPTSSLGRRFYQPPCWRYVVTDLDSVAVTFLDRIATERKIEYDANTPTAISGRVPSADPEVNIVHTDGDPFLAEGNRLLYAFRREAPADSPPWVCRAAGIVLDVKDTGDPDVSQTEFVAFDPWQLLHARFCRRTNGELPGKLGLSWSDTPAGQIALELLLNTITAEGYVHLDAGEDWGGTAAYDGFIADTEAIDYNVQRGKTVGEAWEDLCATGLMDLEIVPIYDPTVRPGYVGQLNVYGQPAQSGSLGVQPRGQEQPQAVFSWDLPPRTLNGVQREIDGRERANLIQNLSRAGLLAVEQDDLDSQAKYGVYERMNQYPDMVSKDRVRDWAADQLRVRRRGVRTVTVSPAQQQPPLLWDEFFIFDRVPVYASRNLRARVPDSDDVFDVEDAFQVPYQRVYGITVDLTDPDACEVISEIAVSRDATQ